MVKLDNPVRVSRMAARLSQQELAKRAEVARMTLVAIEEGSTRTPDHGTLDALARVLGDDTDALARALNKWHDARPQVTYDPGMLGAAAATATSFAAWRRGIEPSATRFAEHLGVSRATLTGYEEGRRRRGMPDSLQAGLLAIGAPIALVEFLGNLEPN
jgi:transcriptional regulator with XRE-family HTH domain